jgi:hypothetical protein
MEMQVFALIRVEVVVIRQSLSGAPMIVVVPVIKVSLGIEVNIPVRVIIVIVVGRSVGRPGVNLAGAACH